MRILIGALACLVTAAPSRAADAAEAEVVAPLQAIFGACGPGEHHHFLGPCEPDAPVVRRICRIGYHLQTVEPRGCLPDSYNFVR